MFHSKILVTVSTRRTLPKTLIRGYHAICEDFFDEILLIKPNYTKRLSYTIVRPEVCNVV